MELAYVYDMFIFIKTICFFQRGQIVTLQGQFKGHYSASIAVTLKSFCFLHGSC